MLAEEVPARLPGTRWPHFHVSWMRGPGPSQSCCSGKPSLFSVHTSRTRQCQPVVDCGIGVTVLSEFSPECTCRRSCRGLTYFPRACLSPSAQPCRVRSVLGPPCVPAVTLRPSVDGDTRPRGICRLWEPGCTLAPPSTVFPAAAWAHLFEGPLVLPCSGFRIHSKSDSLACFSWSAKRYYSRPLPPKP